MEILIRKVENNRATNKRVGGRRSGKREIYIERMGVGAWHLGKTNKIYILLKSRILGSWRAVICTRCLHSLFLCACALCPVPVSSFCPCALCTLCVSLLFTILLRRLLVQFHFQHKVLFYYPEDTNRTL